MKRILSIILALLVGAMLFGATQEQRLEYIKKYSPLAISEMQRTGVPASITLAQGLLESGAGRSTLATEANNHFGIKCHKSWKGKTVYHDDDAKGECFRAYSKVEDSYRDHSDFLRYYDRYKFLFDYDITDYKSWAYGLKQAGYATDPKYATKLIELIEEYDLGRFDKGIKVEVASPEVLEKPVVMPSSYDEQFRFSLQRTIYKKNGVAFVYASAGDTYASIASMYDLFLFEILSFNDLKEQRELLPGEVVYIHAKKNRTEKGLDMYIVSNDGESLWEISQRFGVKMKSIVKRNHLAKDEVLAAEQELKLR